MGTVRQIRTQTGKFTLLIVKDKGLRRPGVKGWGWEKVKRSDCFMNGFVLTIFMI